MLKSHYILQSIYFIFYLQLLKINRDLKKRWWPISESNQGHNDFQSFALPTELIGHNKKIPNQVENDDTVKEVVANLGIEPRTQ